MFSINNNTGKLMSNKKKNYATHHLSTYFSCKTYELNLDSDKIYDEILLIVFEPLDIIRI